MRNKIKILFITYTALFISLSIFPFIFSTFFALHEKDFQRSFDIAKTLAVLTASFLAIIYFDPLGIAKKKTDKQYESVIKVLEFFIGKMITFRVYGASKSDSWPIIISKKEINIIFNGNYFLMMNKEEKIYWDVDEFKKFYGEISLLKTNMYLPKGIVDALDGFKTVYYLDKFTNLVENEKKIIVVDWYGENDMNSPVTLTQWRYSFGEFATVITNVINNCENWLTKKSFSIKDLNI